MWSWAFQFGFRPTHPDRPAAARVLEHAHDRSAHEGDAGGLEEATLSIRQSQVFDPLPGSHLSLHEEAEVNDRAGGVAELADDASVVPERGRLLGDEQEGGERRDGRDGDGRREDGVGGQHRRNRYGEELEAERDEGGADGPRQRPKEKVHSHAENPVVSLNFSKTRVEDVFLSSEWIGGL